jgi:hypothetical protein
LRHRRKAAAPDIALEIISWRWIIPAWPALRAIQTGGFPMGDKRNEKIQHRAYQIWEREGSHGNHERHAA